MAAPNSRRGRGRGIVGEGIINNGPKIGGEKKSPSPPVGPAPNPLNDEIRKKQQNPIPIPMPSNSIPGGRRLDSGTIQEEANTSLPAPPPTQQESINEEPELTTEPSQPIEEAPPTLHPDPANYTEQPIPGPTDINSRLTNHELAINKLAQTMLQVSSTVENLGQQVAHIEKAVEAVAPLIQQLLTGIGAGAIPKAEGEAPGNGHGAGITGIDPNIIGSLFNNARSIPNNGSGKAPIGNVISDVLAKGIQLMALVNHIKSQATPKDPTQDFLSSLQHAFSVIGNVNRMYSDLRKSFAEEMSLVEKASNVQKTMKKNNESEDQEIT
jgi:hypothetical protein